MGRTGGGKIGRLAAGTLAALCGTASAALAGWAARSYLVPVLSGWGTEVDGMLPIVSGVAFLAAATLALACTALLGWLCRLGGGVPVWLRPAWLAATVALYALGAVLAVVPFAVGMYVGACLPPLVLPAAAIALSSAAGWSAYRHGSRAGA